jgi:hypothetical protein
MTAETEAQTEAVYGPTLPTLADVKAAEAATRAALDDPGLSFADRLHVVEAEMTTVEVYCHFDGPEADGPEAG